MIKLEDVLVLIPARGGSKGIPGKNIKELNGKPLIYYTIDIARHLFKDEQICVSTDDDEIIKKVEAYSLKVPFKRPDELASDTASSNDVIQHALKYYRKQGKDYKYTLLLQPTSPFRTINDLEKYLDIANRHQDLEVIVSVVETDANPYFVLFEEDENDFLKNSKPSKYTRRQDCPKVWQLNGAFYLFNNKIFEKKGSISNMNKLKFEMDKIHSVDLDTMLDWKYAEFLINEKLV